MSQTNNDKIKVIQLIHGLTMGGAETMVKDYCLLADKNTEMIVVITEPKNGSENEKLVEEAGVRIISIPERVNSKISNKFLAKFYRHYFRSKELAEIIEEENPDCIHIHFTVLRFVAPIRKKLKGIRLCYTCHNLPSLIFDGEKERKKEKVAACKLIEESGLRMIALHPQMAEELNEMFHINNTLVVNNGIDFKRFQSVNIDIQGMRKSLSIPDDAFVVGHVGRFTQQKNHDFLIDIFYEISKRRNDAFLLMIGIGSLKDQVIQKLESLKLNGKYVILENRRDVPELMKIMNTFVFPSLYEGFGNVLIEAQVAGLRCVISDSIPDNVLLTDHIIPIGLEKSASEWADVILNDNIVNKRICGKLEDYDMRNVVSYLNKVYRGAI